jgi:hypothetical protein
VTAVLVASHEVGGFQSIDVGHVDIEQDDGELSFENPLQRLRS